MNKLTKDEINSLKKVEIYFIQIREGYKRCSSVKEDTMVSEIYTKLTGKVEKNFACGQCSFRMYKTVGDAYWEALDALKSDETDTTKKKNDKPKTVKKSKTNDRQRRTKTKKD